MGFTPITELKTIFTETSLVAIYTLIYIARASEMLSLFGAAVIGATVSPSAHGALYGWMGKTASALTRSGHWHNRDGWHHATCSQGRWRVGQWGTGLSGLTSVGYGSASSMGQLTRSCCFLNSEFQ